MEQRSWKPQRCQGPALLLVTVPWEFMRHHVPNLRAVLYPDRHCHTVTPDAASQLKQKQRWCHVPMNKARSNQPARPREAQLCWSAPSQLATTATAVCKSAPHLLFHLNDLPSLAGLSLSRACIQGNKSYRGKKRIQEVIKITISFPSKAEIMSACYAGFLHHGLATSHLLAEAPWPVTKQQLCGGILDPTDTGQSLCTSKPPPEPQKPTTDLLPVESASSAGQQCF